MIVWGMVLGGYPRSRLARYALRDAERGSIPYLELHKRIALASAEIIGAQKAAGLPVVVDGMVDWHDIFRPFIRSWRNVSVNGLLRYFDNNFFYRIPVFTGEPDIIEPVWPQRVREYSLLADPATLKVVLPGPLTLAKMSEHPGFRDEEIADLVANLLSREVSLVQEYGVYVQIDEPILSDRKATRDDATLAVDLASKILGPVSDRGIFAVYFDFPSKQVLEKLLEVKARYLMLDIEDSPARARENAVPLTGHVPVVGIVDGRRIHTDRLSDTTVSIVKALAEETDEVVVTTTTWMDLIPYRYALKKTSILGEIVRELASRVGGEVRTLWR
ncbi:MAG: hypothetical protein F7C34_04970 [Desulfurococcales archaeon]|nr:hypothetical protein [Desulfurococcales archaeon]